MAILTVNSDLLTPGYPALTAKADGDIRCYVFTMPIPVQADIGSTLRLCRVPQHAVLLPNLSWIQCTALALLTVSLGWEAYLDETTKLMVPANPTGLGTTLTIAAGTPVLFSSFPAAPLPRTFAGAAVLTALTAGANITAGFTVAGAVSYAFYG